MMSLSRQFRPDRCLQRAHRVRAGFTLVEIVIALAVLGTMAAGCYIGFNSITNYAVSSRLYSEAQTAAQNQIDLILSREPFDVMVTPTRIPLELMTSGELAGLSPALGSSTPATTSSYYPYYLSGGLLARDAFIYTDPVTGNIIVKGTVTSQVADVGSTETLEAIPMGLNIRRATVTVSYTFRNTNYTVVMDTMRTADR
jgi:prepilin-type N-terminal cleavage/methylation domain-containing protein